MAKIWVKLKDPGTTFYDQSTQTSVVGDRVALVEASARTRQAISDNQLMKLDKEEGRALFYKQNPEARKKDEEEDATAKGEGDDDNEDGDDDQTAPKKKAPPKKQ